MTSRAWFSTMAAALFTACASQPDAPPVAEAAQSALPAVQTEAEAAQQLEKKFQEAAKGYKVVERDGRTLYCMTEPQLRLQVENMEELRGRMRNSAKCTMGRSGGGGGACGGS
jgi:Skp family chaperone for outer membrane proteins